KAIECYLFRNRFVPLGIIDAKGIVRASKSKISLHQGYGSYTCGIQFDVLNFNFGILVRMIDLVHARTHDEGQKNDNKLLHNRSIFLLIKISLIVHKAIPLHSNYTTKKWLY